MRKTALSIIQNVMYRMNISAPTTIAGTTDPGELQLLQLFYETCYEIREARIWPEQKKVYSFATVANQQSYQLPKDFYAALLRTQWNDDESLLLVGPVSDAGFTARLYGNVASTSNYSYRIWGPDENPESAGGQFYVDPTPSSATNLVFEYLSRNILVPQDWEPSTAYTTSPLDYVNSNGNIYKCISAGTSGTTAPSGTSSDITDGTAHWQYIDDPYETVLADTDLCIFDYDLVQLGLRAKWLQEKGGDWTSAYGEFRTKIDHAVHRFVGSHVGTMQWHGWAPRYKVPYKSWSL